MSESDDGRPADGPADGRPADGTPPPAEDAATATATTVVVRRRKKKRRLLKITLAMFGIGAVLVGMLLVAYSRIEIPEPNSSALKQTSRVYYGDGRTELGRFGDTNRVIVGLDKMPVPLRDAVLAAENRSFYSDNGVSPRGIARALWVNLRGGSTQGGSTITQQYVKNYYLSRERTIKRKFREALLSIKIDKVLTKDQILENYLNTIYLGRGAYGMQAAAKAYFGRDVEALDVAQSAALAGIIQSPSRYDPSDPDGLKLLKRRWTYVTNAMVKTGKLGQAQRDKLRFPKFPVDLAEQSRYGGQKGYILNFISKELQGRGLSKDRIENGGYTIVTTLDSQAQTSAVEAVKTEFPKTKNQGLRVGLVAIQPKTGKILAMYGGKDFLGKSKYAQVNTATVPIQPGSGMKPFATAAALENGFDLKSTFWGNSPFKVPNGEINNEFDQSYGKAIPLTRGLAESINTVFVDLALQVGPEKIRDLMVRAGIPDDAPGLIDSALIPLGIASIRPTEVADAYSTLCGEGIHAQQHMVEKVIGPDGKEEKIDKIEISDKPVIKAPVVADTLRAMEGVVKNGTGRKALALNRPVAGKTGTHQDLTAWFNGCTPQIAASVNYFKGDGTNSLDGSGGMPTFFGGTYPTLTWTAFMHGALRGKPIVDFKLGKGVTAEPTASPTSTQEPAGPEPTPVPPQPTDVPPIVIPTFVPPPPPTPQPTPQPTPEPTAEPPVPTPTPTPAEPPDPGPPGPPTKIPKP